MLRPGPLDAFPSTRVRFPVRLIQPTGYVLKPVHSTHNLSRVLPPYDSPFPPPTGPNYHTSPPTRRLSQAIPGPKSTQREQGSSFRCISPWPLPFMQTSPRHLIRCVTSNRYIHMTLLVAVCDCHISPSLPGASPLLALRLRVPLVHLYGVVFFLPHHSISDRLDTRLANPIGSYDLY